MTNPSPTSTTVLVAAVMLSGGLCFSDAFSTTATKSPLRLSSPAHPAQRDQSTLFYAPKNSFDRDSDRPKQRRPGRPRKTDSPASSSKTNTRRKGSPSSADTGSSSSPAKRKTPSTTRRRSPTKKLPTAPAAAQNAKTRNRVATRQQLKRPTIRNPRNNRAGTHLFKQKDLLSHELLTKEEEQELFRLIKRATDLKETMTVWLETNAKPPPERIHHDSLTCRSILDETTQGDVEEDEDDDYVYSYDEQFGPGCGFSRSVFHVLWLCPAHVPDR